MSESKDLREEAVVALLTAIKACSQKAAAHATTGAHGVNTATAFAAAAENLSRAYVRLAQMPRAEDEVE